MSVRVESPADVAAILERLCQSRAAPHRTAAAAVTMNFIVFIDSPTEREWVLKRAERIADKHPSRMIVLDATDVTGRIDVSCSTRENSGTTILNERVDLGVGRLDASNLAATAQQLMVRDIPRVIWWSGARLLENESFSALAGFAETVVVDSSGSTCDEKTLCDLCLFQERHADHALHDLAFLRLANWQETIALFFDDPALRDDLFSLRSLEIESGSAAEALYLGAWLGSRLGWEALDAQTLRARDGGSIGFTRTTRGGPRRVLRVCLKSDHSTYLAALCDEDETVVRLSIEGKNRRPSRLVPLHAIDNISLIERAILGDAHNSVFERALATVRGLL